MLRQTRVLLWIGFGGLLLLMVGMGFSAVSFLYQAEIRQRQIQQDYLSRDRVLERLRSASYLSGTYVRDFLLDPANPPSAIHEAQFREMRRQIEASLRESERQLPEGDPAQDAARTAVREYLAAASAVFAWAPEQRARQSYPFMQSELLPKRMQVVGLTDQLRGLSERQLELNSQAVSSLLSLFRLRLVALSILALLLGSGLAGVTLRRILRLETDGHKRLEELARLSADLVSAQETERRNLSRELHDEVGQTLYATLLGLGNLRSSLAANRIEDGLRSLQFVHELTERTASVVRNIGLLLRPAMLDDLGLVPALKWLAREATRTQPIPVDLEADDIPDDLREDQVTCVYRVVQEAIHNAERHSHARSIRVELRNAADGIMARIHDDGRGFDPGREAGLGILGMRERAGRLGGSVALESALGQGTTVTLRLPGLKE